MRKLFFVIALFSCISLNAQHGQKLHANSAALIYQLPNTLKAVQFYCEAYVTKEIASKGHFFGTMFSNGLIGLQTDRKGKREIVFKANSFGDVRIKLVNKGLNVSSNSPLSVAWPYEWSQPSLQVPAH